MTKLIKITILTLYLTISTATFAQAKPEWSLNAGEVLENARQEANHVRKNKTEIKPEVLNNVKHVVRDRITPYRPKRFYRQYKKRYRYKIRSKRRFTNYAPKRRYHYKYRPNRS